MNNFDRAEQKYITPPEADIVVYGHCEECGELLTNDYEAFEDSDKNLFCDDVCFKKYYGFKEVGEC